MPKGLAEEAAQLEKQWPKQMQELEESGQPLNMAKKADIKYIDYLHDKHGLSDVKVKGSVLE